jgi:hypothetical protein
MLESKKASFTIAAPVKNLEIHNPTICEYGGGYLCIVAHLNFTLCWNFRSPKKEGYLIKVDEQKWMMVHRSSILKLTNFIFTLNSNFEVSSELQEILPEVWDCSLLPVKSGVYVFGTMGKIEGRNYVARMCYSKIDFLKAMDPVEIIYRDCLSKEKNWSPFVLDNDIYLIYSIFPFKVLKLIENETSSYAKKVSDESWELPWSLLDKEMLHGGTRAVPYNDREYLSLCHLVAKKRIGSKELRTYKIYAYTFSRELPFRILRFSSKPILDAEKLDLPTLRNAESYWLTEGSKVVFERGLVLKENHAIISYGEQDRRAKILVLEREKLDNFLKKI